jgi:dephospho-CoA kinase
MKRVVIAGNAGGGKTVLSKRLSSATGLPLIFLDKVMKKLDPTYWLSSESTAETGRYFTSVRSLI